MLADTVNNQLANIKTILLQDGEMHKIQISRDIYSIFVRGWFTLTKSIYKCSIEDRNGTGLSNHELDRN